MQPLSSFSAAAPLITPAAVAGGISRLPHPSFGVHFLGDSGAVPGGGGGMGYHVEEGLYLHGAALGGGDTCTGIYYRALGNHTDIPM